MTSFLFISPEKFNLRLNLRTCCGKSDPLEIGQRSKMMNETRTRIWYAEPE